MSELTPYLCVADARAAIAWYVEMLGAEVSYEPIVMPDDRIGHAEFDSAEFDSAGVATPDATRGSSVALHNAGPVRPSLVPQPAALTSVDS